MRLLVKLSWAYDSDIGKMWMVPKTARMNEHDIATEVFPKSICTWFLVDIYYIYGVCNYSATIRNIDARSCCCCIQCKCKLPPSLQLLLTCHVLCHNSEQWVSIFYTSLTFINSMTAHSQYTYIDRICFLFVYAWGMNIGTFICCLLFQVALADVRGNWRWYIQDEIAQLQANSMQITCERKNV